MMYNTGYDELFVFKHRADIFPIAKLLAESKADNHPNGAINTIKCEREDKKIILISTNSYLLCRWEYEIRTAACFDMPEGLYDVVCNEDKRVVLAHLRADNGLLEKWPNYKRITDLIGEAPFVEKLIHSQTFEVDLLRMFPETTVFDMNYVAMIKNVTMDFTVHWKDRTSCIHFKKCGKQTDEDLHICLMPRQVDIYKPAFTGKKDDL